MGFFGRKPHSQPAAVATPSSDIGDSAASRHFFTSVQQGNLDVANQVIDRYLAGGGPAGAPSSLLDRAAAIAQDLRDGLLDDAASALNSWDVPYGSVSSGFPLSPEQQASLRALGLSLINYFAHPDSPRHHRYDELMDGKLAGVAKSARLARDPVFDSVYAQVKSQREINRVR